MKNALVWQLVKIIVINKISYRFSTCRTRPRYFYWPCGWSAWMLSFMQVGHWSLAGRSQPGVSQTRPSILDIYISPPDQGGPFGRWSVIAQLWLQLGGGRGGAGRDKVGSLEHVQNMRQWKTVLEFNHSVLLENKNNWLHLVWKARLWQIVSMRILKNVRNEQS